MRFFCFHLTRSGADACRALPDATAPLAHELVPNVPPPESIEAMLKARQVFARFAWQFPDNPKLAGYLYRVKCPTCIVWGEHDGVVPVTHGHVY
jgi:pimeloyl-ACP methyl ester carboxylesterase